MKPTNLLFILSDEHNRDTLGCYGHDIVRTPHLDSLAERGVRFDAAYTNCPICVPARASLATGQYVHGIGYWDNAHPYEGRVRSWGHRLIDCGHPVVAIGKLHYRSAADDDGFSNKITPLNVVDGIGDVMGSIRDESPIRRGAREGVLEAGPGRSTYLDYDADIARRACQWLTEKDGEPRQDPLAPGWLLFVSFVCPHPPFIAPPELYESYPLRAIPLPVQNRPHEWPSHPAIAEIRRAMRYDEPFTEEQVRRVTAAYYGTCTFLDEQIGSVLSVLERTSMAANTRIIYTSDHGENMGRRGLWGKFTMYEESAAVPLIVAGPDVPSGGVCRDIVSLVDCYPTILDAFGIELDDKERRLPGCSLWPIAEGESRERDAFGEYHAVASRGASYMLRHGRYKYVHYVDGPPQLFDLEADAGEVDDLATSPAHGQVLADLESRLREIVDPEAVDRQAKRDQRALVDRHGGPETVLKEGAFTNSPVPGEAVKRIPGAM